MPIPFRIVFVLSLFCAAIPARTLRLAGSFTTGSDMQMTEMADVNRDGRQDVITCSYGNNSPTVYLSKGGGQLSKHWEYSKNQQCRSVAAGDLNRDGKVDLVVVTGDKILVLFGFGDGTFWDGPVLSVLGSYAPKLVDLNKDGWLDIVVPRADISNPVITTLINTGGGQFGPPMFTSTADGPNPIAPGDYNGDGIIDLAVGCSMQYYPVKPPTKEIDILTGNGDGTFRLTNKFTINDSPYSIVAADLDQDGKMDLVVQGFAATKTEVLWGTGTGVFTNTGGLPGYGAFTAHVADFDGDGKLDVCRIGPAGIQMFRQIGQRTFDLLVESYGPWYVAGPSVGDIDGDGRPDVVAVKDPSKDMDVWLNSTSTYHAALGTDSSAPAYGEPLTLTAVLSPYTPSFSPPAGVVTWLDGNEAVGTTSINLQQHSKTYKISHPMRLAAGSHSVSVTFAGTDAVECSALRIAVAKSDGVVNLTLSNYAPGGNSAITFTASVSLPSGRSGQASGTVTIRDNGADLATVPLGANSAAATVRALAAGAHQLQAFYSGDSNINAAASQVVSLSVVPSVAVVAAANGGKYLAPQAIASAYGSDLAPGVAQAALPLPETLNGTTVTLIDAAGVSHRCPLFFVSPGQVNFLVPSVAPGTARVEVRNNTVVVSGSTEIVAAAPGLFAASGDGKGVLAGSALRVNRDGSVDVLQVVDCAAGQCVPVPLDISGVGTTTYVVLYGSGIRGASKVTATIGGIAAKVEYFGPQGQFAGLDQINLLVPRELSGQGTVDVVVTANELQANVLTFDIR